MTKKDVKLGLLTFGELPAAQLAALAQLAEGLGYDVLWCADEKFHRDPFGTIGYLSTRTRRLKLGIAVTEPYARHPALIAMAVGTLAELAPGRIILGLGAGGAGFPPMGIKREKPVTALREAIQIIRGLLSGERVDFQGKVVSFRGGQLSFSVSEKIPIILGTRSRGVLQLAGGMADGVMMAAFASSPGLKYGIGQVEEGAQKAGRRLDSVEIIARVDLCIAADGAVARETAKPGVALPLWASYPNFQFLEPLPLPPIPQPLMDILAKRDYYLVRPSAHLVPDEYVRHMTVAGTLEEVVEQMREIAGTGVDQITIFPVAPPGGTQLDIVRAFAREVMPRLGQRG